MKFNILYCKFPPPPPPPQSNSTTATNKPVRGQCLRQLDIASLATRPPPQGIVWREIGGDDRTQLAHSQHTPVV